MSTAISQTGEFSLLRSRISAFNRAAADGSPSIEQAEIQSWSKPDRNMQFYGGAKELWDTVQGGCAQTLISGPAETGKTLSALHLVDELCWDYPKAQGAIIRKVGADLWSSVIPDFEGKVLKMVDGKSPYGVTKYGGEKPEFYKYPNGSKIWVCGLDHPGKVLSAQRDFVYTNQTEEFDLRDWQTISTRTTGRAGVIKPGRLIGDCNPGPSTHWIISLNETGTVKLIKSNHKDNPTLFDPETGAITEQGKRSMANLDALTGVLYKRLRLGLWVAAEGVVYEEFDPTVHVIDQPFATIQYHIAGVDWGLSNPGVIQVWGVDGDGRMYRVHEVYQTGKLVAASNPEDAWWIITAKELRDRYNITVFVPDPSRPDHIEAFEKAGLLCEPGFNSIEIGIQNVQSRLKIQPDGWPRIALLKGSRPVKDPKLVDRHLPTCLEEEIEVYARPKDSAIRGSSELPIPKHNHACDTLRYSAGHVDGLGQSAFVFG